MFLGQTYPLYALGRWDEALALAADVPDEAFSRRGSRSCACSGTVVSIHCPPRRRSRRRRGSPRSIPDPRDSADLTERAASVWAEALLLLASGDAAGALRAARDVLGHAGRDRRSQLRGEQGGVRPSPSTRRWRSATASEPSRLIASVEAMESGTRPQSMAAHAMRHPGADRRGGRRAGSGRAALPPRGGALPRAGNAVPDGRDDARARRVAVGGRREAIRPPRPAVLRAAPWLERARGAMFGSRRSEGRGRDGARPAGPTELPG